ncbi:transcription antitermination factor NusB [Candidatus Sumerlaeota bacterium]|nr:transcription antitermination factor NusB [Candidatus Sumerlaeota bacterium]
MQRKSEHRNQKSLGRRRQSRELALQLLYALEITKFSVKETIKHYAQFGDMPNKIPMGDFTKTLLKEVKEHIQEVDAILREVIANWRLERLSYIDRNILRLAACEIFYFDDIPPKVTINEYIEIAKDFGDDDSPSFINGILDRIARESPKGKKEKETEDAGGGT